MKTITITLDKNQLSKLSYESKKRNRNLENTILDIIDEIKEKRTSILSESEDFFSLNYPELLPFVEWVNNQKWDNLFFLESLRPNQIIELSELYELTVIRDVLIKMENYGTKIRKYRSLFLTLKSWLRYSKQKGVHQ